ncbi:hypothetical protein OJAV_G00017150 [Oryzias javanicus]|uniref:EF-hand domain-containing protein n=1 Tax=Oryzias javanicus TaxID=123683 RepID=A0A437DL19_ORYJA|nr:hypothetical protein OJAV_G00017150 [Oryzias javanicus]
MGLFFAAFHTASRFYNPNPIWQRSGTKEKLASALEKVDNMTLDAPQLPVDHAFGIVSSADSIGAGEIIHRTDPGQHSSGPLQALRHRLKNLNLQNFPSVTKAFQHYDKIAVQIFFCESPEKKRSIDTDDLKAVFREFLLDVNPAVLDQLLACCGADGDGLISFTQFSNFLNWKGFMPLHSQKPRGRRKEHQSGPSEPAVELLPLKPEDLDSVRPSSTEKTVRTLRRTSAAPDQLVTSSSVIGAVRNTADGRACGVPSVRSDLPAPPIKRMGDTTNYGDSSTAADLLHPSVHAPRGVHEEHLLCPRSKEEVIRSSHQRALFWLLKLLWETEITIKTCLYICLVIICSAAEN